MTEISVVGENVLMATWGWEIALYLFLGGLVAGLMIFSGFMRMSRSSHFRRSLFISDIAGLPILGIGMFFLFVDLSNKINVWRLYTTFQLQSPMSWGAWILLATMLVLALRFVSRIPAAGQRTFLGLTLFLAPPANEEEDEERKQPKPSRLVVLVEWVWVLLYNIAQWVNRWDRTLAVLGIVFGTGVGFYTGVLLSTFSSRPLWNTAILPPLFLISALGSAGAFLCLFLSEEEHVRLLPFSLISCGVELLFLLAFVLNLSFGSSAAQRAGLILFSGPYGWTFWGLVWLIGLLLPAVLELMELLNRRVPFILPQFPPTFKLIGSLALRMVIVYAGVLSFM